MAMKVKLDLTIPQIWSAQDSMIASADTIALVRLRTYSGKDTSDKPLAKYSTRPIYVEKDAPLEPRGGVQTERGMYFKGGYREYKMKSRRYTAGGRNQTAEVDLTLSGALMNNLITTKATKSGYTIGLSSAVKDYGYRVNARRSFIGLSPTDQTKLTAAIASRIRKKLAAPASYTQAQQSSVLTSVNAALRRFRS